MERSITNGSMPERTELLWTVVGCARATCIMPAAPEPCSGQDFSIESLLQLLAQRAADTVWLHAPVLNSRREVLLTETRFFQAEKNFTQPVMPCM